MSETPESTSYRANDRPVRRKEGKGDACDPTHLPAAAMGARTPWGLFLITLLSAVDGTLVMLGASGRFSTLGGAVVVGLTVIAGAGSWVAAREAFGGRRLMMHDKLVLVGLGAVTVVATVAATWLGATLGQSLTLHVMPKAAGVVLLLIGAEVGGLRVPRVGGAPLPLVAVAAAAVLEAGVQWIP